MRTATQSEIDQIAGLRADVGPGVVLHFLMEHPHQWFHVALNEMPVAGNLQDQMKALVAEAKGEGRIADVQVIPGHRDGGFFARVRR